MLLVHVGRDGRYLIVLRAGVHGHEMHNVIDNLRGFMHTSSSDRGNDLEVDTVRHLQPIHGLRALPRNLLLDPVHRLVLDQI